ncbi:unnamed protein product, partial [Allacma fusca]
NHRMELQEKQRFAKFEKVLTLGDDSVKLKGEFLFCWPYSWEDKVHHVLTDKLSSDVTHWVAGLLPEVHTAVNTKYVESTAQWCVFGSPTSWRQKSLEDPEIYAKLLLYCKVIHYLFLLDDITETKEGDEGFTSYVQCVGSLIMKIWRNEVGSANIKTHQLFHCIYRNSAYTGSLFRLLLDITEDMRRRYGISADSSEFCARRMGSMYTLRTWCGYKDQSFLLNPFTQYLLRNYTGGILFCLEFLLLLEKVEIPTRVRENTFWSRCYEIFGFLPVRSNDIIGVEKEWIQMMKHGKRIDNVIFHYMVATSCSFEEAVARAINKHNFALKEQ